MIHRLLAVLLLLTGLQQQTTAQSNSAPSFRNCKQCIVLSEQSVNRVAILDLDKKAIVWEWRPDQSPAIKPDHVAWFKYPSDAKPVYNGTAILTNASGGGVALIRIADKKVLFYAYAGGNTHSAEMLPDGNIVAASSTGNFMTVFRTDTLLFPEKVYSKQFTLPFGHNVVWDKTRQVLWSAAKDQLKSFTYNNNQQQPDFQLRDSVPLTGTDAHDLFPVYDQQALWLTNTTGTYRYDLKKKQLTTVTLPYHDVKSVSSGPGKRPIILVHPDGTKGSWWTDEINAADSTVVYKQPGLKIYKVRWFVDNPFSY
jgi:hypothetical protein